MTFNAIPFPIQNIAFDYIQNQQYLNLNCCLNMSSTDNGGDSDDFEVLIQKRIDALLNSHTEIPSKSNSEADAYAKELLAQFGGKDYRQEKSKPLLIQPNFTTAATTSSEDTQKYVRELMRSCFHVEDQAAQIKGKYGASSNASKGYSLTSADLLFSGTATFGAAPKSTAPSTKPLKTSTLSKQEKLVLASATHSSEEQAEDAMLALSLLQQYKKDPSFIQKELKDQAKKREVVLGSNQEENLKPKAIPQREVLNPLLTQEERHRSIQEKREQRKKEQKMRLLEESKERRLAKEPPQPKQPQFNSKRTPTAAAVVNKDIESAVMAGERLIDVEKIKEEKRRIEQDAKESQEEFRKIKEELKRYKQEIKDQEKARRELEEQQEHSRKLEVHKQAMQVQVANARQHLFDYKLSKFTIIMSSLLAKKAKAYKFHALKQLTNHSHQLHFKEVKLAKLASFMIRARYFRQWNTLYVRAQHEREMREALRVEQLMAAKELTAENHRKRSMQRAVLQMMRKFVKMVAGEREIEKEHERRKNAIDEFFVNMKEKARIEEERVKQEKLEKIHKEQIKERMKQANHACGEQNIRACVTPLLEGSIGSSLPFVITPSQETQGFHFASVTEQDTINFDQYKSQQEEQNKVSVQQPYDLVPSRQFDTDVNMSLTPTLLNPSIQTHQQSTQSHIHIQPFNSHCNTTLSSACLEQTSPSQSSQQLSQTSSQQPPQQQQKKLLALPQRPKQVTDMEERARARKDKRDALQAAYAEKQKKVDEERRANIQRMEEERKKKAQDEKDAKKRVKMEEMRRAEEIKAAEERERERLQEAREYYKRGLLIKYGIVPLARNVEMVREAELKADTLRQVWTLRNGLIFLKQAVKESRLAEQRRIDQMFYFAIKFNERKIQRTVLLGLKMNVEFSHSYNRRLRGIYLKQLLRRHISYWSRAIPLLKQEKQAVQMKEDLLVRKFRLFHTGRSILRAMAQVTKEERIEREKAAYKQKMWSKVNTWLADIDHKAGSHEDDKPQLSILPLKVASPKNSGREDDILEDYSFREYSKLLGGMTTADKKADLTTLSESKPIFGKDVQEFTVHEEAAGFTHSRFMNGSQMVVMEQIEQQLKGITMFDEVNSSSVLQNPSYVAKANDMTSSDIQYM